MKYTTKSGNNFVLVYDGKEIKVLETETGEIILTTPHFEAFVSAGHYERVA